MKDLSQLHLQRVSVSGRKLRTVCWFLILNDTAEKTSKMGYVIKCFVQFLFLHHFAYIVVAKYCLFISTEILPSKNEGFLSSVPTLASAQADLNDETFRRSGREVDVK
jgi:hypothetical protein